MRSQLSRVLMALPLLACGGASSDAPAAEPAASVNAAPDAPAYSVADARAAVGALDVAELTSAPARVVARAELDADIDMVWAYLSNHDNLVEYSNGILSSADIDRSASNGSDGVGVRRTCEAGEDRFVERVVHFQAPYVFAYTVAENTWGLSNHLAVVALEPTADGGTALRWSQHYDGPTLEATAMLTQNLSGMLEGRILSFLTERFGGSVVSG
ncbi:MAG: SRPBCC family protein [Myxococcota bacterium]